MLQAYFARPRRFVLALVLGAAALPIAAATAAEPVKKGAIEIAEPWARATAPSQGNGAAYMVIRNHGPADRVVRAEAAVSRKVELHTHEIDAQGVARMIEIPAIELPAHATTELKPGGLHVMLIGLHRPLEAGSRFPLTLVLEKAGEVELEVEVRRMGGSPMPHAAGAPMPHGAGHGMPHGAAAKSH